MQNKNSPEQLVIYTALNSHDCGLVLLSHKLSNIVSDNEFLISSAEFTVFNNRDLYSSCYNHWHHSQAKDWAEKVPQNKLLEECGFQDLLICSLFKVSLHMQPWGSPFLNTNGIHFHIYLSYIIRKKYPGRCLF